MAQKHFVYLPGDILVTRGWVKKSSALKWEHAALVVDVRKTGLFTIDCLGSSCTLHFLPFHTDPTLGKRARIIRYTGREATTIQKKVVELAFVVGTRARFGNRLRQFARLLVQRCLGDPDWSEINKYARRFQRLLADKKTFREPLRFFCSRFVLLLYQVSVVLSNISTPNQLIQQCFAFNAKACRPSHVASLANNRPCWNSFEVTDFDGDIWDVKN